MTCDETRELLPIAALDALDVPDALELRSHVRSCPACAAELTRLRAITPLFSLAPEQLEPPRALRASILRQARAERSKQRPHWLSVDFAAQLVAAVVIVGALGFGFSTWTSLLEAEKRDALAEASGKQERLVQLVAARPNLVSILSSSAESPRATAQLFGSRDQNVALLLISNLPELQPDRAYQVWLLQGGLPRPIGVFGADVRREASWTLTPPERLGAYQAIWVTEEPAGGSAQPSERRLLLGLFSQ